MKKASIISVVSILIFLGHVLAQAQEQRGQTNGRAVKLRRSVKVLIGFDRPPGRSEQALVRGIGGRIKYTYHIVPAIAATVAAGTVAELRARPEVTHVELDGKAYAIDAELDNTWGVKRIGAGIVHTGGNKGAGVKVAVIDSGIDYTHPDLDGTYAGGYDFVNNDSDPMDDNGHGTHVAGTIAAEDDDSGVVGVAPEASLYALKVLGSDGSGPWSGIIAAMQWCVDNGIQIANLSLGHRVNPGATVKAAFDNAEAAGVLIVAAAGNEGTPKGKGNNMIYPAKYDSVIAVAATDINDDRAWFSSTGDQAELAAPGVNVNSTMLGGGYGTKNGTSMASPHVAGTGALVIAAGIADANDDGRVNDDIRQQLDATADDLGDSGRDPQYGFGLVDADEATDIGPPNAPPVVAIISPADGSVFASGATVNFSGTASDTEDGDLTAALTWTSNIDGLIGTGGGFSTTLSDGNHIITSSATDSGGKTGSDSVNITVGTPPALHVAVSTDKPSYTLRERVYIIVVVTDAATGGLVEGAAVHLDVTTASGRTYAGDDTTDADGKALFWFKTRKPDGTGTYTADANAAKPGYNSGSGSTTFEVNK